MKLSLIAIFLPIVLTACPSTPVPVVPDDGDCDAGLMARKCPPCVCTSDAGPIVITDSGATADAGKIATTDAGKVVDAGPPDLMQQVCDHLAAINCSTGKAKDCGQVLRAVMATTDAQGRTLFRLDIVGMGKATTIAQANAAGADCK